MLTVRLNGEPNVGDFAGNMQRMRENMSDDAASPPPSNTRLAASGVASMSSPDNVHKQRPAVESEFVQRQDLHSINDNSSKKENVVARGAVKEMYAAGESLRPEMSSDERRVSPTPSSDTADRRKYYLASKDGVR